jgi:hypothetical protein
VTTGTLIAAIAAVCAFSAGLVKSELAGSTGARAETAPGWQLEARWWPGELGQVGRQVGPQVGRSASTEPDLTFSKGYPQRVAARQAARAARLATIMLAETQFGRPAVTLRKPITVARNERTRDLHGVADASVDHSGAPDFRTQALAFGEPQPQPRALFGTLFGGNL